MIESIVFYILAIIVVVAGFVTVTRPNLLHAALALMVVLIGVAGFYVLLSADFLAAVQVILYVGGVLVLIIFAIMLTEKLAERKLAAVNEQKGLAVVVSLAVLLLLLAGLGGAVYKVYVPKHSVEMVAPEIEVDISEEKGKLKTSVTDTATGPPAKAPLWQGKEGSSAAIGEALMTDFVLPFEVASILLLAAIVGAILFTRKEEGQ